MIEGLRSARWRGILRAVYFVPSAISLTVAGLLFYFIYEPRMGILNAALDFLGLQDFTQAWLGQENTAIFAIIAMSQWQGFGYCTLLFAVALQRFPPNCTKLLPSTASVPSAASSPSPCRWYAR